MFCGNDKTLKWEQDGQHVSLCDRKCSTEGVVVEETSVNPRHRLFLTLRIRNHEAYTLYASYLGRNVWENHVFKMGGKKPPTARQEIFWATHWKNRTSNCSLFDWFLLSQHPEEKIKTKTSRKINYNQQVSSYVMGASKLVQAAEAKIPWASAV